MSYPIVECSPKARERIRSEIDVIGVEREITHRHAKYPWLVLKIGQSFTVPLSEGNEISIRNGATQQGKKTGKKFAVIRHNEYSCIEVARIA